MTAPKRDGTGTRWRWSPGERADPARGAELARAFHALLAREGAKTLERRLCDLSAGDAELLRRRWLTNAPELLDRVAQDYESTPAEVQRMEGEALRRLGARVRRRR